MILPRPRYDSSSSPAAPQIDDVLAANRRRLGTALHQLASELARERQRNRQLAREVDSLRARLDAQAS